jgi:hypothetical protein
VMVARLVAACTSRRSPDSPGSRVSAVPHESVALPRADLRRRFDESTRGPQGPRPAVLRIQRIEFARRLPQDLIDKRANCAERVIQGHSSADT